MTNVTVFTQPNCAPCRSVKKWLTDKGVDFVERDVTVDSEALTTIGMLGYAGTPVIQTESDSWIGVNLSKMKELL